MLNTDAHAREYAGAVAGMADTYGARPQEFAVGDSLTIRVPGTVNTTARATVIEVLSENTYHVAAHLPGQGRQHFAVTPDDVLPF